MSPERSRKHGRSSHIFPRLILLFPLFTLANCAHIEQQHEKACERLLHLSQKLDAFLSEPREDEEYHEARVCFSGGFSVDKDGHVNMKGKSKAKIPLPGFKDKWGVILGGESDSDLSDPLRSEDETFLQMNDDNRIESFLRFFNKDDRKFKLDFDIGVRFSNHIKYFTRFKISRPGWIGCSHYRLTQRFYWRNDEGFGTSSRAELDQKLSSRRLCREFIDLIYSEESEGIDVYAGFYFRTFVSDNAALSFETVNSASTHPWVYHYFEQSIRFRHSIHWKWLELEIRPVGRWYWENTDWRFRPYIECLLNLKIDASHL